MHHSSLETRLVWTIFPMNFVEETIRLESVVPTVLENQPLSWSLVMVSNRLISHGNIWSNGFEVWGRQTNGVGLCLGKRYKHAHCGAVEMSVAPNEARKLLNQFEFPRQRWQTRVVYPCCLVVKSEDCSSCPSWARNLMCSSETSQVTTLTWIH
jgi:hypothetical protein